MKEIERRVAALEAIPPAPKVTDPHEQERLWLVKAARCGFTEAQVRDQFGGVPGFIYAWMRGRVVDPEEPPTKEAELPPGMTPMQAYMAMLNGPLK
jgi:hypothetical protein